jgi:hypothetical protein
MINPPQKETITQALRLLYIVCICVAFILTGLHMGYQVAGLLVPDWVPLCIVITGALALVAGLTASIIEIAD